MTEAKLSRRTALSLGAALPLAAGFAGSARAGAEMMGPSAMPMHNRVALGGFEVTTLLAGQRPVENPHAIFGMNVDAETFEAVSKEAFLPTDVAQFFFTPTLVNTGAELILFDTGFSSEGIITAIEAAGYTADQVDKVVITHMHGDHIGGLMGDTPTFANASYITGADENNYWSKADSDGYNAKVAPLLEKTSFVDDGAAIASGVTAVSAFGHTPGHMTYMLESDGAQLLLMADTANHYIWSVAHPDWEVKFDMDKTAAAQSRRKILGMLSADRVPVVGYHMPFPGMGYIAPKDDAFEYVPVSYQMML